MATPPCSKVLREASETEARAALQGMEREAAPLLQGAPLHEPLFQLLCHGSPAPVKAAMHDAIAAWARLRSEVPLLLQRLVQCVIVSPQQQQQQQVQLQQQAVGGAMDMVVAAVAPKADMLTQITEVEARQARGVRRRRRRGRSGSSSA